LADLHAPWSEGEKRSMLCMISARPLYSLQTVEAAVWA
jgi:hypothetical protein